MFIEQKIKSGESNNLDNKKSQLRRYSEAIDINPAYRGKTIIKIFLTPTGRLPQKSKGWIPMTHQEIIHSGRKLLKDESLSPVARGNLTRFLLDMAVGPYNQTEELLTEMKKLAEGLCSDGFALHPYIRYSSLNQHHSRITELIREGSEWTK